MSRFSDDGDETGLTPEMWWHNIDLAIKGKRGQKALRELLQALEAVPGHVLVRDYLADDERGVACAVGAYAAYKRIATGKANSWGEALHALRQQYGYEPDGYEMGVIGKAETGMTTTLAQHLAYQNDEGHWRAKTPEELWQVTYDWVKSQLVDP